MHCGAYNDRVAGAREKTAMHPTFELNQRSHQLAANPDLLRVTVDKPPGEARVIDCGVKSEGSLSAGLALARICLADLGDVTLGKWGQFTQGHFHKYFVTRIAPPNSGLIASQRLCLMARSTSPTTASRNEPCPAQAPQGLDHGRRRPHSQLRPRSRNHLPRRGPPALSGSFPCLRLVQPGGICHGFVNPGITVPGNLLFGVRMTSQSSPWKSVLKY